MNNYCSRVIEKYINRKLQDSDIRLFNNNGDIIISEWNILDKIKPTDNELQTIFNIKEKEIYQDICIKELNTIYLNKFLQEIFDTWKINNTEYQTKLTKIMNATKAKLKDKIENKVEL